MRSSANVQNLDSGQVIPCVTLSIINVNTAFDHSLNFMAPACETMNKSRIQFF
jgi:hypothetical protein